MAHTEHAGDEEKKPAGASVDYTRYQMNPVDVEERSEVARAMPRRIGVAIAVIAVIAVAVLAIGVWQRLTAAHSPLDSLDSEVRQRAHELVDNILNRTPALTAYVYDVKYPSPTLLYIYLNPTVSDKSDRERNITDTEIQDATRRVVEQFRGYGPPEVALQVKAFVAESPEQADLDHPTAIGTYDPQTQAVNVELTSAVTIPGGRGSGTAPPGSGHLGEHGGTEPQ